MNSFDVFVIKGFTVYKLNLWYVTKGLSISLIEICAISVLEERRGKHAVPVMSHRFDHLFQSSGVSKVPCIHTYLYGLCIYILYNVSIKV